MSVQTTVLENGRWVTRNVDPYRVRAQNTETPRKEQSQPSINLPKTPSVGILTKTLVRSSVINRIIPARIRHKTKNDVLFISANSVTVKEARGDCALQEIAIKSDFDSTIKSARIIGERRELTKLDYSYQMPKKAEHWDATHTNEDDDFVDEGDPPDRAALNRQDIPPHVLVLALESNRLVFLCAISGKSEHTELFWSQKVLPAPPSPLEGLGELIAVDPKSRAMAVAAHEGRIYIYALKSMNEMRAEFKENSQLGPIKEEKLVLLDGNILKMEFLHPPENELNRIILLLVVARGHESKLIWYDWNADMPLHQSQLRPNKMPLHPDEELPLLLIPLTKNTAFILVCEKRMVLIKDILTGSCHRFFHRLAAEQEPQEPGISTRRPIWVQWARPMRSKKRLRPNEDNIILCREDGIVQYMVIDPGIEGMIDSNHHVGRLGVNINTSFATVDLGLYTQDLLVAGGDESDGGLWDFPPRQIGPNQRGTMPNWAPINDLAVANVPNDRQNAGSAAAANNASKGQPRLFACSGRGIHGAISEIRYGVEASKKMSTVDLDHNLVDELKNGVLGVWAFHGFYGKIGEQDEQSQHPKDVTCIIVSHPLRTYLLLLPRKGDQYLIGDDVGLDLNARTIAAGCTIRGLTIQITESSLRATSLHVPALLKEIKVKEEGVEEKKPEKSQLDAERPQTYEYHFGDSRILAACMHITADNTITVVAAQRNEQFYLEFGIFDAKYQPLDQRIPLRAHPSCLSLLETGDETLVLVGTLAGELEIHLPGDIGSGLLTPATPIQHAFTGPFGICDSVAAISRATKTGVEQFLVCGLRDGTVETLQLSKGVGTYHVSLCEKLAFGHTSVTVLKDTVTSRVIVHCENTLCTLQYPQKYGKAPATVLNVWITDPSEPSLQQGNVSALNQVVDSWLPRGSPGSTVGSFVCIDGNLPHIMSLNSQPKMVPRRLKLSGTPVRVLYSVHLDKLIVLHNKFEVLRAARQIDGQRNVRRKRALRPMISFLNSDVEPDAGLDPDAMEIDDVGKPNENQALMKSECKPGERFLGITEWFPKVGSNEYPMLVINTTLTKADKPGGRLLIFAITKGRSDQPPKLVTKKVIDTNDPVFSVAMYPDKSLVYCCGNDLYMQSLEVADPSRIKLSPPVKLAMRSPGRHISVKEPYIYVSSSRESLSVYRYDADQLVYQFGDQSARCGLHHLQLPSHSLVLASDMSDTVVGLWQPPERRIDNAMTTVFEAVLPGSITRLRRITRPMWSHDPHGSLQSNGKSPASSSIPGDEVILGSSADGTLTQMSILSSIEWRLLRFIQNMAERHPLICPFHPGNPNRRHIEPSGARPHYMHINGDILERIVDRDGESLLNEMLDVEPDHESHTDFGSKEERRERFDELAKEVLKNVEDGEVLGRVVLWLRYLLRNVL